MDAYGPALQEAFAHALMRRLGLAVPADEAAMHALVGAFWAFLQTSRAPFEQAFFDWYGGLASETRAARSPAAAYYEGEGFARVRQALRTLAPDPAARLDHPYFQRATPCTMLIDEVEALWAPIAAGDDWSAYRAKLAAIDEMAEAYGTRPAAP